MSEVPLSSSGTDLSADISAAEPRKTSATRELVHILIFALVFSYVIKTFLFQPFKIPTGSMENTLLVGDLLLVNKFIYGATTPETLPFTNVEIPHWRLPAPDEPRPGDVLVFKYPPDPSINYIKRCIAVGGQTVEIRDKKVFVDGVALDEANVVAGLKFEDPEIIARGKGYEAVYPDGAGSRDNYGPVTVPPGHVFAMGDNRDRSVDSRHWGFIPMDYVIGKAFAIIWSSEPSNSLDIRWHRIGQTVH